MKIAIVMHSAMKRTILNEIFSEHGDEVVLLTSNWKDAAASAVKHTADTILFGNGTCPASADVFYLELSRADPLPQLLFMGDFSAEERKALSSHGYSTVIPQLDMQKVNDGSYRETLLAAMTTAQTAAQPTINHLKELKAKYLGDPVSIAGASARGVQRVEQVVIGSSTGGPKALKTLFDALPANFPVPIAVVQHLDDGHEGGLASYLNRDSKLKIRLAVNNDRPVPGEVILAVQGKHLIVKNRAYYYVDGDKVNFQRPAVDRLFFSAAAEYGKGLAGILLTGMGKDGAVGCVEILRRGGKTIVQDETTSTVYGMPRAAVEMHGASIVLPLGNISEYLLHLVKAGDENG